MEAIRSALPFFGSSNKYRKCVTDRGGEFLKNFGERLNLKHYYVTIGPYRKISLVERAVRSFKAIFFRLLIRFPSQRYSNLIHLTQIAYNSKPHSGIFHETPHRAQHFDYTASKILRKILEEYKEHQEEAQSLFRNLKEFQKIKLGDSVRIRHPKQLIRKESSVFTPQVTSEIYTITRVDRTKLPYVYSLNNNENKRYYAWSLLKVSPDIVSKVETYQKEQAEKNPIIILKSIMPQTTSLRSGKTLIHPQDLTFEIEKNGQQEFVDKNTLVLYKKLFGSNVLQYDQSVLDNPLFHHNLI